eukprot:3496548-Rhodomonas_salina.1
MQCKYAPTPPFHSAGFHSRVSPSGHWSMCQTFHASGMKNMANRFKEWCVQYGHVCQAQKRGREFD